LCAQSSMAVTSSQKNGLNAVQEKEIEEPIEALTIIQKEDLITVGAKEEDEELLV
jgi:hypothetical protein